MEDYDDFNEGWSAARERQESHGDVATHYSQGNAAFDKGWNAFIDQITEPVQLTFDFEKDVNANNE